MTPFIDSGTLDIARGNVASLLGENEDAVRYLRRGTQACITLEEPALQTRAWASLAQTLEASGDRTGACEAYRVVLTRWSGARPRSVSAELAHQRALGLGCVKYAGLEPLGVTRP
jgi:hypothetical protein